MHGQLQCAPSPFLWVSPAVILPAIVQPTFASEGNTATDGSGTAFNQSTIPVTISGPNPLLIAVRHSEFGNDFGARNLWTATFNGVPGRRLVTTDGYHGGAANELFCVYYWVNPPAGTHDLVVTLTDSAGGVASIDQELAVSAVLLNNVAQVLYPFRDVDVDVDPAARTGESVTVSSLATDLVCHVIANSLTSKGTLGAGETSRSIADDGSDDASIWFTTKNGGAGTTTVSSSGWTATWPVQGIAFAVMGAGTAEDHAVFTDDLTRANESPLSKAGIWTSPVGAPTVTQIDLVSNQAKGSTAVENMAMVNAPSFPADQRAQFTYVGAQYGGAAVRIQGPGDASCYVVTSNSASSIDLYKITDSGASLAYALLTSFSLIRNLIPGDTLELEAIGTTLNVYWNQVLMGSFTDATFAGGQPGLRVYGADPVASAFEASSLPVRFA